MSAPGPASGEISSDQHNVFLFVDITRVHMRDEIATRAWEDALTTR
jgi:hypothetical protein